MKIADTADPWRSNARQWFADRIDAAHRGLGYGQAAFDAVMAWASQAGVGRAELMGTAVGRGMYERAGFQDVSFPAMRAAVE